MSSVQLTQIQPVTDNTSVEYQNAWKNIISVLRDMHGEAVYRSWFKALNFIECSNGKVTLAVPTRFIKEWINNHYGKDIRKYIQVHMQHVHDFEIIVRNTHTPVHTKPVQSGSNVQSADGRRVEILPTTSAVENNAENVLAIPTIEASLDPRFTFDTFVVGKPNELAHAAARRVAESEKVVSGGNPLFLYGGVGLGKTHLMHAIAWHIFTHTPERKVVYLSAEKFMYQFIRALRFKEAIAFKEYFRSVDVLMIDDVQFISGKDSTQEEFFHTFNALVDQNKQLVISCDRSPSDLEGMEERIKSRLGWGLVADIHATSYELRLGILQSKIERIDNIHIPKKVLEFLAHKIVSNVRELEGALNRVVAHATLVGKPITLETTQELLQDLLRANDKRISVEDIQKQVAGYYSIKVSDMHSARRSRTVARPRQVAMYLSKKLTTKSLPDIGRKFGGKDHTTVIHAVKRVEELMQTDHEFAQDIELLMRMIRN